MEMSGRLSGKVAIVTGATRGMGVAHARRLHDEGAAVVVTGRSEASGRAVAGELGAGTVFVAHDVTSADQWERCVAVALDQFGGVDVLVNNAGITLHAPLQSTREADFQAVQDANVLSVFLGMKTVAKPMADRGGGSIINISSGGGLVAVPNRFAYVASKFAVTGMSKAAAIDLAADRIRVNAVHPGAIRTPLFEKWDPEDIERYVAGLPLGRVAEPEEVAGLVAYLASDESAYCTGASFVIDGGFTAR
jgi:3alpha(or 20beta)-hydroxysteroid dehydrogenase